MPDIHPSAWVAPSAQIFGAVAVGERASIWHNAVLRAECVQIQIGRMTNLQDFVMVHVGYDDPTRRFIVRNSWGTSWGTKGYFTMPYEYLLDGGLSDDFWTVKMVE